MASWGAPLTGATRDVALEVLINGPLPRSELARRLELSAASLTRLTKPLLDAGLLVEGSAQRGAGQGRPTYPLDVVLGVHHFVGIKLTSDAAYGVLTDIRSAVLASDVRPMTDPSPDAVLALALDLVKTLERDAGVRATGIGVTVGGLVDPDGLIVDGHFLGWHNVDLGPRLQAATGIETVVANDVAAWTQVEHWFGAGRGFDTFALVTIGAGVGHGLVAHGRLVGGYEMGVGLVSHIPLDPLGPPCPLGHRGCSHAMLTTGAIQSAVAAGLGRFVSYDECLDLAADGVGAASAVVLASGRALGRFIATAAAITTVTRVIVAGEGARLAEVAGAPMRAEIAAIRPASAAPLDLVLDFAGFVEWARGAAMAAIQRFVLGA